VRVIEELNGCAVPSPCGQRGVECRQREVGNSLGNPKVAEWTRLCLDNPSEDRWVEVRITELGSLGRFCVSQLKSRFELITAKATEMFETMVAGQCTECQGVISGEQILLVGAYQQADGVIGASEFLVTLARGVCPGCANTVYGIKWIGGNW
jgi:hypothetical protein